MTEDPIAAATRPPLALSAWLEPLLVALIVGLCMSWALGEAPLARTEGHRALTAHQMAGSGSWLLPKLYGHWYLRKPPLYYWTLAATERALGRAGEWVWRLPSVLAAALTAGFLAATARRWFGPPAGLVAGLSFLGLVALWSQSRGADIDAMNTLAATVAAVAVLEILHRRWAGAMGWTLLAGAALGAMLLLKGPSAATVVLGAHLAVVLAQRRWLALVHPLVVLAWLIGAGILLAWLLPASAAMQALDISAADAGGARELGERLLPSLTARLRALAMPLEVLVFGLPVSAALLFALDRRMLRQAGTGFRRLLTASCLALLLALALGAVAGVDNPRYLYVALPMLGLGAGGVASAWARGWFTPASVRHLRAALVATAAGAAVLAVVLAVAAWRGGADRGWLVLSAAAAVAAGGLAVHDWLRGRHVAAAWSMVILLVLAAMLFGETKNQERRRNSQFAAAQVLRQTIGDAGTVIASGVVFATPELFHYAQVEVVPGRMVLGQLLTPQTPPRASGWMVLSAPEWELWRDSPRVRQVAVLRDRVEQRVVAWYTAPGAATHPATGR